MTSLRSILVCGNMCTGKSTLGHRLARNLHGRDISFGDLKREHLVFGEPIARSMQDYADRGEPIPPDLAFRIVEPHLEACTILSGFPISRPEMIRLEQTCCVVAAIHLVADHTQIERRFFARGECPVCLYLGTIENHCPEHGVKLVQRNNVTPEEFQRRVRLYEHRIVPFVASLLDTVSVLRVDTTTQDQNRVLVHVQSWLNEVR